MMWQVNYEIIVEYIISIICVPFLHICGLFHERWFHTGISTCGLLYLTCDKKIPAVCTTFRQSLQTNLLNHDNFHISH